MEKLNHPAILVVDMLNDFVTGSIGCDRAVEILPATARLLDAARAAGVPVIYCNDSHLPGIDRELQIWGDHAIKGTPGAEVVPELAPQPQDYVVPKRRYSGFFQTDLDILLKELGVKTVVITGLHTHMCCRHTSADAYCLGDQLFHGRGLPGWPGLSEDLLRRGCVQQRRIDRHVLNDQALN